MHGEEKLRYYGDKQTKKIDKKENELNYCSVCLHSGFGPLPIGAVHDCCAVFRCVVSVATLR